jgi:capping protein alpha
MSEVETIVRQIIKTSPAGDDSTIITDIKALLNNVDADKLISNVLREHYTSELQEDIKLSGDIKLVKLGNDKFSLISNYNVHGLKFYDLKQGILFDYDFINGKVIDIENSLPSTIENTDEIKQIQKQLDDYIFEYYNELSYGLVVPNNNNTDELIILIVGEKLNDANYYNGKWVSVYSLNKNSNELFSIIKIKIHYYEDGNVVMNSINKTNVDTVTNSANLVDSIKTFDSEYELNILKKINVLNEEKFKNLRRLMPISRSKIQWGRAIGNYKLGQDVVGGRH